jgi:hypothetical protein
LWLNNSRPGQESTWEINEEEPDKKCGVSNRTRQNKKVHDEMTKIPNHGAETIRVLLHSDNIDLVVVLGGL